MPEQLASIKWKPIVVFVAAVILVIAGIVGYFLMRDNKIIDTDSLSADNEAKTMAELNRQAVAEAGNAVSGEVRPIEAADHVSGDAGAPVQLIVYEDYEDPFCADFDETLSQVREEFGGRVTVAYRHFFLPALHPLAFTAALAAECADEQGKFAEMRAALYAANRANGFTMERIKADAAALGLDATRFNDCLDTEKYRNKVEAQVNSGDQAGVTGTPTIFVNGRLVPGALPFDDFTDSTGRARAGMKTMINDELGN